MHTRYLADVQVYTAPAVAFSELRWLAVFNCIYHIGSSGFIYHWSAQGTRQTALMKNRDAEH